MSSHLLGTPAPGAESAIHIHATVAAIVLAAALAVGARATAATGPGCFPGTAKAGVCHGQTFDPRLCGQGTRLACGKLAATVALRIKMSHGHGIGWDAAITCRGFKGLLHYRCTWQDAADSGVARVEFKSRGPWTPRVVVLHSWTCAQRPRPGCRQ